MTWQKGRGPGWGGPRRGPGWGGPPKGAGHGGPAKGPGKGRAWAPRRPDPAKVAKAEDMLARLYLLATRATDEGTRLRAAVAVLDRIEGKPLALVVQVTDPDLMPAAPVD